MFNKKMKNYKDRNKSKIKTEKSKKNFYKKKESNDPTNNKNSIILQNKIFINLFKFFIYFFLIPIYLSEKSSSDLRKLATRPKIEITLDNEEPGIHYFFSNNSDISFSYLTIYNKFQKIDNYQLKYLNFTTKRIYNLILEFNFGFFSTPDSVSFKSLFDGLDCITRVDFSGFNKKVSDMRYMFRNCKNLKYVNFGNLDTSKVSNMEKMFYNTSLIFLDLSKLSTIGVTNMNSMFSYNKNLLYLNLNNFDVSKVSKMEQMFSNCESLLYLNALSFKEKSELSINSIFSNINENLIYCINKQNSPKIATALEKINTTQNNCSDECFQGEKKLVPTKQICYSNCNEDEEYIYEYDNLCYNYSTDEVTESSSDSIENLNPYPGTNKSEPKKLIENDVIIEGCTAEDFLTGLCDLKTVELTTENKDKMINNIVENIVNGNLDSLISEIISGESPGLFIQEDDIIFQLTTTENQLKDEYNNISTIDLGGCEDELKFRYGINPEDSLIILKVDYFMEGLLIPIIGYEIFDPTNKTKLNLSYCKDYQINYNIPVKINEDEIDKYNINSKYYKDECSTSTSKAGTDMTLNDRLREHDDYNMSLCENKCNFSNYDISTKKSVCICEIKSKIYTISEILNNTEVISKEFNKNDDDSSSSSSSLNLMKCFNTIFSKYGLLKNIGNYILILIIVAFTLSSIFFYKVGYTLLENEIKQILSIKEINEKRVSIYKFDQRKKTKTKKRKKKPRKSKKANSCIIQQSNPNRKKSLRKSLEPNKKNLRKNMEPFDSINTGKEYNHKSFSKFDLKGHGIVKRHFSKVNEKENVIQNSLTGIVYSDFELNNLSYKEALERDKRNFMQYYVSLIKFKQPILFSFYPCKDYNTMIIKVDIFMLSLAIIYAMNALFFNDSTIHQIYIDKGSYNLGYFLPQAFYAFILSHFVVTFIKFIFLSEKNILEIKHQETREKAAELVDDTKRCLTIKYIIFYVLGVLFLILFWYYLSSVGAIYKNSQTFLIINTFISSIFSLLYPFFVNLFPAVFRINSLNNNNKECIFFISKIFQFI